MYDIGRLSATEMKRSGIEVRSPDGAEAQLQTHAIYRIFIRMTSNESKGGKNR